MTPKEKWDRLNNPTCLADYGLSLSRDELMQFPEGRAIAEEIDAIRKERERTAKMFEALNKNMGIVIRKAFDDIIIKTLKKY